MHHQQQYQYQCQYLDEGLPKLVADQAVDQDVGGGVESQEDVRHEAESDDPGGESAQVRVLAAENSFVLVVIHQQKIFFHIWQLLWFLLHKYNKTFIQIHINDYSEVLLSRGECKMIVANFLLLFLARNKNKSILTERTS